MDAILILAMWVVAMALTWSTSFVVATAISNGRQQPVHWALWDLRFLVQDFMFPDQRGRHH